MGEKKKQKHKQSHQKILGQSHEKFVYAFLFFRGFFFSETPRCPLNRFVHKIVFPPPPSSAPRVVLRIFY